MNPALIEAEHQIHDAEARYKQVVYDVICECEHETIGACSYHSDWYHTLPPRHVCWNCGLTEEGWGIGYIVLKDKKELYMSRDDLNKAKTVLLSDEDKSALFRKTSDLSTILKNKLDLQ